MIRRILALSAAAVILLVAGCGAGPGPGGTQLEFTAETLGGKPFSGASLKGRPAVLWFWAPGCPTCQREAPLVARVAAVNPTVTFVGVGVHGDLSALREFATKYGVDRFTELADTDAAVRAKFGVTHQPAYAFVSPDGGIEVVKSSLGESELTTRVKALTSP